MDDDSALIFVVSQDMCWEEKPTWNKLDDCCCSRQGNREGN